MRKDDLIGRWKLVRFGPMPAPTSSELELLLDGSAISRNEAGDKEITEHHRWEYIDETHFQMLITIPADPNNPGLEEGASERVEYQIVRFTGHEMEVMQFDSELPFVYQRVNANR